MHFPDRCSTFFPSVVPNPSQPYLMWQSCAFSIASLSSQLRFFRSSQLCNWANKQRFFFAKDYRHHFNRYIFTHNMRAAEIPTEIVIKRKQISSKLYPSQGRGVLAPSLRSTLDETFFLVRCRFSTLRNEWAQCIVPGSTAAVRQL